MISSYQPCETLTGVSALCVWSNDETATALCEVRQLNMPRQPVMSSSHGQTDQCDRRHTAVPAHSYCSLSLGGTVKGISTIRLSNNNK